MNELRKDYLLDRFVIIAPGRAQRPHLIKPDENVSQKRDYESKCPFCPGNEHMLNGITSEVKKDNNWIIRVVPNKFGAVSLEGDPEVRTANKFYTYASAYGVHEVIVETPEHDKELENLSQEHIMGVLQTYVWRIKELHAMPHIKYVSVFKNRGIEAGASIPHSHSQVIAYNIKPSWIAEELRVVYNYIIQNESCPYCEIIQKEKDSDRRVFENEFFVAFTPYASRFPYELWIFPKRHVANIVQLNGDELNNLASLLKKFLSKLEELGVPPYNLILHNAESDGENYHFYLEISPRLAKWAGMELETGTIINKIQPEEAAKFYRGEWQE